MTAKKHPFKSFNSPELKGMKERQLDLCREWIMDLLDGPDGTCYCPKLKVRKGEHPVYSCQCLSVLQDQPDGRSLDPARTSIAFFMLYYHSMKREDRTRKIMDWMKYSYSHDPPSNESIEDNRPRFLLPFETSDYSVDKTDFPHNHKICKGALAYLLDIKYKKWDTMRKALKHKTVPQHGNAGRSNRARPFVEDVKEPLHEFLQRIMEMEGAPQSTRVVREDTGSGLRDGEEDVVELPPSLSKRELYRRFCEERNWKFGQTTDNGGFRPEPLAGNLPICSWSTFTSYWNKEFPNLRQRKAAEDVCTLCFQYSNRFRMKTRTECEPVPTTTTTTESGSDDDEEAKEEEAEEDDISVDLSPTQQQLERDKIVEEAALHVQQASGMRLRANQAISDAQRTFDKPHNERVYTVVMDYAQNCELPHLGNNQPGKTYYYSPLKINVFGIVDGGKSKGFLDAYVYHEGEGKKGGNNVASLLMFYLKQKEWLKENCTGKELNIVCDNCGGQNKNNMVIRLAPLLVELGYFKRVNFLFYIAGHTKNIADRFFNSLKRQYRRQNIWTMAKLIDCFNTGGATSNLQVHKVEQDVFFNYGKLLDSLYCKIEDVSKGHIFSADHETFATDKQITIEVDSIGSSTPILQSMMIPEKNPRKIQRLPRKNLTAEKVEAIATKNAQAVEYNRNLEREKQERVRFRENVLENGIYLSLEPEQRVTLSNIKRIELGTKFRALVPEIYKDDPIYAKPTQDSLDLEKRRKKRRKLLKDDEEEALLQPEDPLIDDAVLETREEMDCDIRNL